MIIEECEEILDKLNFSGLSGGKFLVTGASGLIGLYLISCLKHLKKRLDIEIYAWIKNDITDEIKDILSEVNVIKADITDVSYFDELDEFDYIIHAAGYGQPGKFLEDRIRTISINTTSTLELLRKVKSGGKFLFISTSELYNGLETEEITESQIGTTNTDHPRSSYIEGKRCGEAICHAFTNNVDVKIVRLSLAYGPGTKKNDHRVLNSIIQKSLFDEKIELLDNGDAVRTYCYITDVIEMIWNIFLFGREKVYNVAGQSKTTILNLAQIVGKMTNKSVITPKMSNSLSGNPKVVNLSIEKYNSEFGTNKLIDLEEGLLRTINWQKKIYRL